MHPGGEVYLRHVKAAGDEWEAGDHEQHGADVGGVVVERDRVEYADEPQRAHAGERRHRHRHEGDEELVQVVREQSASRPLAESGTDERADHVVGRTAEQEHEGRAGAGGGESGEGRRIERLAAFDQVEALVHLAHRDRPGFAHALLGMFFEMVEMLGVFVFGQLLLRAFGNPLGDP